jgi:ComF family protein
MPFESKEGPERLCGECAASARPFESARSAALYDGAILDAVRLLKYHSRFEFVKPLSRLLVEALRGHGIESDAVVMPVPLHEKKLRERCFNQSLLMARGVARAFSLGLDYTTLVRSRPTASQTGLKADERRENVRGAFIVIAPERVKGKTVLLVDDVYTTGSTIAECSKVLKKAGARTRVMTVARSV